MRLGQFARKYDIRVQDLISYMENDAKEEIHSNTKLSGETEADILDFFGLDPIEEPVVAEEPAAIVEEPDTSEEELEAIEETKEEPETEEIAKPGAKAKPKKQAKSAKKVEEEPEEDIEWDAEDSGFSAEKAAPALPETPMDDIALAEGELATPLEQPLAMQEEEAEADEDPAPVEEEAAPAPPAEDEVIQTDKLLELLESEDPPADLDKIKLIKAPKRELSGLKVLGKVDLPEPKKKPEPEEGKEDRPNGRKRNQRPQLSAEEKEKRRLKAKRKQEAYEARQEKRRREQEAQKLKELRESHYKQRLEQQKLASKKARQKVKQKAAQAEAEATSPTVKDTRPEPKTVFGKVWRWLNSH